jgi:nicotinate-nucleotide adenylyltransferase
MAETNHFDPNQAPAIEFIRRSKVVGPRVGVFASSFNPPTTAHLELVRHSARSFSLDQLLVLVGRLNADKISYDCPLDDRLKMLQLAFEGVAGVSIGITSRAFFVDMVDAIEQAYQDSTDIYFIVGFDTFVRILDREDRYTSRYARSFDSRSGALAYLLSKSHLIVAGRAGSTNDDVQSLLSTSPEIPSERVFVLNVPAELAEQSASRVRSRIRSGLSITGLVPEPVQRFIEQNGIYRPSES